MKQRILIITLLLALMLGMVFSQPSTSYAQTQPDLVPSILPTTLTDGASGTVTVRITNSGTAKTANSTVRITIPVFMAFDNVTGVVSCDDTTLPATSSTQQINCLVAPISGPGQTDIVLT